MTSCPSRVLYRRNIEQPATDRPSDLLPFGVFFGTSAVERIAGEYVVGVRDAEPSRIIDRHTHESAHFVFVLSGRYVSTAKDGDTDSRSLLIYNPPGTTHADCFSQRAGTFAGRFASIALPKTFSPTDDGANLPEDWARAIRHVDAIAIARLLAREVTRWEPPSPIVAESLILELLEHVVPSRVAIDAVTPPSWLERGIEQLRDRCADSVSIGELARDAGVHPVHFARIFRRYTGTSPGAVLRQARTARALSWLRRSNMSLSQVALECGFVDQSHLSRVVRAATGHPPQRYRRVARANTPDAHQGGLRRAH